MITPTDDVSAPINNCESWEHIEWNSCNKIVFKLQMRIVKAVKESRWGKVKALQRLLTRSFSGKALAVKRVTENRGKTTAGVDGKVWSTSNTKLQGIKQLKQRGYNPKPLKRIYVDKKDGTKRPLSIPTILDRAMQALYLQALDPVSETVSDRNSYGFRPKRSCADAIQACFLLLARGGRPNWILEADIKGCFDNISHEWLMENIPMEKKILQSCLNAKILESKTLYSTTAGTPQGGVLSPLLANMALNGIEEMLERKYGKIGSRTRSKSGVHMIRYADDFIISGKTKEILENEVKPLIAKFLQERSLDLSSKKTKITSINDGFDFLGQNIRKYNGKYITKPSKDSICKLLLNLRKLIKDNGSNTQAVVIKLLNSRLRGWSNYYRYVCAKKAFSKVDHEVWCALWKWAKRRHPYKGVKWVKNRYFTTIKRSWEFATPTNNGEKVSLLKMSDTPIRRHTKIRADANPYDSDWQMYFEKRANHTKKMVSSLSRDNQVLLVA